MNLYFQKQIKNMPVKRRRPGAQSIWVYIAIALGCLVAYGFVAAARNHFNAVELGYRSEELKRQREQLELDQRKLTLELERRTAPQKLDMRAQQQGLTLPSARQTAAMRRAEVTTAD
jgi:hypothetical protein